MAVASTACGTSATTTGATPPTSTAVGAPPTSTAVGAPPTSTAVGAPPTTTVPTTSPVPPVTAATPSPDGPASGPGSQPTYAVQPQPAPGTCHYRWVANYPLPDPSCTPGAVNPQVNAADVASTICRTGWTATVRPPEDVTGPEKVGSASAYGYTGSFSVGEYDHLVPLELGGDPNDPANLWLEPNDRVGATTVTNSKDGLENRLRELVCSGQVPLGVAQQAIATDWVAALHRYGA